MPRRKQLKIRAKDLSVFGDLVKELSQNPLLEEFDMDSLQLLILKKKAPPKIIDVEKAISNLERYAIINKDNIPMIFEEQIITQKLLARMVGFSRQSVSKWIKAGIIQPVKSKHLKGELTYPVDVVLEQLKNHRDKKEKKK